jgi:pyridoxal phosphate enzyme (YggS family)
VLQEDIFRLLISGVFPLISLQFMSILYVLFIRIMNQSPITLEQRLNDLYDRIRSAALRSNRKFDEIQLVAVSKTVEPERMIRAIEAGVKILGENRVQEAKSKWPLIEHIARVRRCEFHLVGHLQTNKAKDAVKLFDLIHSVDSARLAKELDHRAEESGKIQRVLIEVNTSGEATKFGVHPHDLPALAETIKSLRNLRLEGLMTIGPLSGGVEATRASFRLLRTLRDRLSDAEFKLKLSMGMTQDFEIAIEEGADFIRIGTAIFGERI